MVKSKDLVVDFMRCEEPLKVLVGRELSSMPTSILEWNSQLPQDKLDDFTAAQMKFNVRGHAATIPVGDFPHESWHVGECQE